MPSEEVPLPAKEKAEDAAIATTGPVKTGGPNSKGGCAGESRKMARGSGEMARKSNRPASEGEKDSGFSGRDTAVRQREKRDREAFSCHVRGEAGTSP